jgi:hypothetical protein
VRARLLLVGGALAVAAAVLAFLLAADVGAWHGTLAGGDLSYPARTLDEDPWQASTILPFHAGARVLGVEDDLAFRRALRLFRLAGLRLTRYGPEVLTARSTAQSQLTRALRTDPDRARRAREANMLGVIFLVAAADGTTTEQRRGLYRGAASSFATAVRLDPGLEDAKYNLELTLIRDPTIHVSAPGAGGRPAHEGHGAGLGGAGSGY